MVGATEVNVLERHAKSVTHMRMKLHNETFGLGLGAGVSRDFGFPTWKELIERIATHDHVAAQDLIDPQSHATAQAEILWRTYVNNQENQGGTGPSIVELRRRFARWTNIVRDCLYDGVDRSEEALVRRQNLSELWPAELRDTSAHLCE